MKTTLSLKLLILSLCVAIIGGIFVVSRFSQRIAALENEKLSLSQQNSDLTRTLADARDQAQVLTSQIEAQTADIAKLRGQLADAKRLASAPTRLKSESLPRQSTTEEAPSTATGQETQNPALIPVANWRDLGSANPENAVQSFLWSLRTRNPDRLVDLVDPADSQMLVKNAEDIASELAKVTGYTVLNSLDVSPTQRIVRLRLDEENGEIKTEEFHFVNLGGQWRFSENAKLAYLKTVEKLKC